MLSDSTMMKHTHTPLQEFKVQWACAQHTMWLGVMAGYVMRTGRPFFGMCVSRILASGSEVLSSCRCSYALSTAAAPPGNPGNQQKKGNNWNYKTELSALAVRLGHTGESVPSLEAALHHEGRSVSTSSGTKQHYVKRNRLSMLGRSTMMHYVNEYLFFSYPMMDGSMLKDLSNSIVNDEALATLANHFGVTDLMKTKTVQVSDVHIVSEALCGVVGAVYRDQGPKLARKLVHDVIIAQLAGQDLQEVVKLQHPRFMLNTLLRRQGKPKPVTRLISESGRATHFPSFVVGVYSGESCLGEGTGTSLRRAETEAMLTALRGHFQKELSAAPLPSDQEEYVPEEEFPTQHQLLREEERAQ